MLAQRGGSFAQITGNDDTFLGFTFSAGGAIAGFAMIHAISIRSIERLQKIEIAKGKVNLKLYLVGSPDDFVKHNTTDYKCSYCLLNEDTGERRELTCEHRWEAGFLTLDVRDVEPKEMLAVQVKDGQSKVWECDFFRPTASKIELKLT